MNNRIFIRIAVLIACCGAVSYAAINRRVKSARDLTAPFISRVCLVSLEAKVTRVGMKGGEPLVSESEEWAGKLREMLTSAITGYGWTLAGDLSTNARSPGDPVQQAILRVREKYDSISVLLYKKPGKLQKGRYTLGDEVALLPCSANADSLLFVDAAGLLQTGGRKAFSILVGGSAGLLLAQNNYSISMAFVDATTGEVTALVRIGVTGRKTGQDPEKALTARLIQEFNWLHLGAPRQ